MTLYTVKKYYSKLLNEYASSDNMFTSISGKHGTDGAGKKADNIAVGQTEKYKDDTYLTQYEKRLPRLAKITQSLKINKPEHAIEIIGPALEELLVLVRTIAQLKKDEKGEWILPMGDNLRLVKVGNRYMAKYVGPRDEEKIENEVIENPIYEKEILPDFT